MNDDATQGDGPVSIKIIERPLPPIPMPPHPRLLGGKEWDRFEYAVGAFFLRAFRMFGAKRRERIAESAKRQSVLDQFWKSEMQRLHPTPANQRATIVKEKPIYR